MKKAIGLALLLLTLLAGVHAALCEAAASGLPAGYTLAAENEHLVLLVQEDEEGIAVQDKRNGETWYSTVPPEHYKDAGRVNKTWVGYMSSMFQLNYTPIDKPTGNIKAAVSVKDERVLSTELIENGVAFHYDFTELSIHMDLLFTLEGDSLACVIPMQGLREEGGWGVTSISLLPFFLSSRDTDEGYYVYPNGSGELYRFKDQALRSNALYTLTMPVYSPRVLNSASYPVDTRDPSADTPVAMLPVFGAVRGGGAVSVVIEDGDVDSAIVLAVGGVSVPVNRIYPRLYYRTDYGVLGQEIYAGGQLQYSFVSRLVDPDRRGGDRRVTYTFLDGENADYSGIAVAARRNLVARGVLGTQRIAPDLVLDILMGVEHARMVGTEFLSLTTFAQARDMVEETLRSAGNLIVNLKGWGQKGVLGYPRYFPANGSLGGNRGLEKLAAYCRDMGTPLMLQLNGIKLYEDNGGFRASRDASRDGNGFVVKVPLKGKSWYLSSAARLESIRREWLDKAQGLGAAGITWEDAGTFIYDDFTAQGVMRREDMAAWWRNVLGETGERLGVSAAEGGNACVLAGADLLREIPEKSALYYFGDESIPLLQMVLHGSAAYTGQPVNVFYDEKGQVLKMLEYGFTPCFELAARTNRELLETDYNMVFSLCFDTWKDSIAEIAAVFAQNAFLRAVPMEKHIRVSEDVWAMRYEDGSVVAVNYGGQAAQTPWGTVEAEGYLIWKEDAQ